MKTAAIAITGSLVAAVAAGCVAADAGDSTDDELRYRLEEVATSPAAEVAGEAAPRMLEASATPCVGVPGGGIDSYDGFPGYYARQLPYADDELVTLQIVDLEQVEGWMGVTGDYNAIVYRDGLFSFEGGGYLAVPNNPAIGPAIGFDRDGDELIDEVYFVLGVRRNLFGNIAALCLGKPHEDGSGTAFAMTRMGL
jgi:hypothetical protein